MDPRRVVVTGLGALTPAGNTADEFWSALKQARSGIGPITKFDAFVKSAQGEFLYPTRIAGEVRNFDLLKYVDKKEARRLDPFLQYAMACSVMAVEDADLDTTKVDGDRFGVLIGSGIGGIQTLLSTHDTLREKGPDPVSPFFIPMMIVNMASGLVSTRLCAKGADTSVLTACAPARPRGGRRRACDGGRPARRAARRLRGRLHQRARDVDALQRQVRDARDQARLRRARPASRRLVHEVHDRPPPGRRRRRRGDRDRARAAPRRPAADDQLRDAGSGLRPRLRAESGAQAGRRGRAVERVRLRRHERDARLPQVPQIVDPVRVAELERRLDHRLRDPALPERALTHASYANEHPPAPDHEPLALLGDAALGLVVAEHLLTADPGAPVGVLTPRRAELVSGGRLARWATELDLGALVRVGRGEEQTGGRTRGSILAPALLGLLAAVALEGGPAAQ